jgi:acyl carrier protein
METIKRIEKVLQNVFEDKNIKISENTTANDIPAWDSLMHMIVISEIEEEFGLNFSFNEVGDFKSIGDIVNCINNKGN